MKVMRYVVPVVAGVAAVLSMAGEAQAIPYNGTGFVIREAPGSTTSVASSLSFTNNSMSVLIDEGNEKAGYGSTALDGQKLSSLISINYTRLDGGTGEIYSNIWVTDNAGNYATIAPAIGMNSTGNYTGGSNINGVDLRTLGFNIHEFNGNASTPGNFDWLVAGAKRVNSALLRADNSVITLADIGHLFIFGNTTFGGGGAAKGGTGINLIFGDTANNHLNGVVPYSIGNLAISTVPLPSAAMGGVALLGMTALRRRR